MHFYWILSDIFHFVTFSEHLIKLIELFNVLNIWVYRFPVRNIIDIVLRSADFIRGLEISILRTPSFLVNSFNLLLQVKEVSHNHILSLELVLLNLQCLLRLLQSTYCRIFKVKCFWFINICWSLSIISQN